MFLREHFCHIGYYLTQRQRQFTSKCSCRNTLSLFGGLKETYQCGSVPTGTLQVRRLAAIRISALPTFRVYCAVMYHLYRYGQAVICDQACIFWTFLPL